MKMTLKNRIELSLEVLIKSEKEEYWRHWNDIQVVFHAANIAGSKLSQINNRILMSHVYAANELYDYSRHADRIVNFNLKHTYIRINEFIKKEYTFTPHRVYKLFEITTTEQPDNFEYIEDTDDIKEFLEYSLLQKYLDNLNDLRKHSKEMSTTEVYDFSFDMIYELFKTFPLFKGLVNISLLIMYWIQRENGLIPLAVSCNPEEYLSVLPKGPVKNQYDSNGKKLFREYMRKMLDSHLKKFIREVNRKNNEKQTSRERILQLVKKNPEHTAKTMASCLGLSVQAVQKQIAILKAKNKLRRVGPDHGGHWEEIKPRQVRK